MRVRPQDGDADRDGTVRLTLSWAGLLFHAGHLRGAPRAPTGTSNDSSLRADRRDRLRAEYIATERLLFESLREPAVREAQDRGPDPSDAYFAVFDARLPAPSLQSRPATDELRALDSHLM
jgi:hypothetical protein